MEKALGLTWATSAVAIAAVPDAWAEVNRLGNLGPMEGLAAPLALVVLVLMSVSCFRGLRSGLVVSLHLVAIAGATLVAGQAQPDLWTHPFGYLVLNINAAAVTVGSWRMRRGMSHRFTSRLLVGSVSLLWFTQGLLPKMLFQHPLDLELVGSVIGELGDPSTFLWALGAVEIVIALLTLVLRGRRLRMLLLAQVVLLVGFSIPSALLEPDLLMSPFAPIQKTLLVALTAVVARSLIIKT